MSFADFWSFIGGLGGMLTTLWMLYQAHGFLGRKGAYPAAATQARRFMARDRLLRAGVWFFTGVVAAIVSTLVWAQVSGVDIEDVPPWVRLAVLPFMALTLSAIVYSVFVLAIAVFRWLKSPPSRQEVRETISRWLLIDNAEKRFGLLFLASTLWAAPVYLVMFVLFQYREKVTIPFNATLAMLLIAVTPVAVTMLGWTAHVALIGWRQRRTRGQKVV